MFAVMFELTPLPERLTEYSATLRAMRSQVQQIPGFISTERFASRAPSGKFLVISFWKDERAIATYRANHLHHTTQIKARSEMLRDYRLTVGRVISEGAEVVPAEKFGDPAPRRYLAVGAGPAGRFIRPPTTLLGGAHQSSRGGSTSGGAVGGAGAGGAAGAVGVGVGVVPWVWYDSMYEPGKAMATVETTFEQAAGVLSELRLGGAREMRVIAVSRDYGMFDRDDAPQYHTPISPKKS